MEDERLQFLRDDPELDGTDAAHPAYWRGHDHALKALEGGEEQAKRKQIRENNMIGEAGI